MMKCTVEIDKGNVVKAELEGNGPHEEILMTVGLLEDMKSRLLSSMQSLDESTFVMAKKKRKEDG